MSSNCIGSGDWKKRLLVCSTSYKGIILLMAALFILRIGATLHLGVTYGLGSDDLSYINSGIYFAKTGVISMHSQEPSAQIMPGMTVFIGLMSMVFGEGKLLWAALKLVWAVMGTACAWYIYRSVSMFAPGWCGLVACLPLFRPDFIWTDSMILTETPFLLCLLAMVYYTLRMGQVKGGYRYFWLCLAAYMGGLMLKANIGLYPLFAFVYLLAVKYDIRLLLKQCVILACAVLCFVVPWSIRNYHHFDAFIPLTYGAGNPTLLGTYQGIGYPDDAALDYVTNVDEVVRERYAKYYGEDGNVLPQFQRYVALEADGVKAAYRQKVWWDNDPKGFLVSYLLLKPQAILNSIFYWYPVYSINSAQLVDLPYLEIIGCIFTAVAACVLKKYRAVIAFVLSVYIGHIYIYSMTFAFDRYGASLIYLRYIVLGIGLSLGIQLLLRGIRAVQQFEPTT